MPEGFADLSLGALAMLVALGALRLAYVAVQRRRSRSDPPPSDPPPR